MFYHFYNKTGKKEVTNAYFSSEVNNSSRFFYDFFFMLVRHFCMNVRCVNIGKYKHFMSVISGFICGFSRSGRVEGQPCTLGFFVYTRYF